MLTSLLLYAAAIVVGYFAYRDVTTIAITITALLFYFGLHAGLAATSANHPELQQDSTTTSE